MSIFKKLFKRKGASTSNLSDLNTSGQNETETEGLLESPSQNSDVSSSEEEKRAKLKQLKISLRKLRKQDWRLRRRHQETLALDAEVTQVVSLIALAKRHVAAFDQEILTKKHELNHLQSEITPEQRTLVKKNEPVYNKRLAMLKTTADAQKLLVEIHDRLKIFRILELMIYNKGLDLKHNIGGSTGGSASTGSKRSAALLKNKHRHFDHLADAIRDRQTHSGAREIALQSMALAQSQSHAQSQSQAQSQTRAATETSREIQCFRMPSPETTQAAPTLPPPSGGFSALFPTSSPLSQGSIANIVVPMPPPLPNMETSI